MKIATLLVTLISGLLTAGIACAQDQPPAAPTPAAMLSNLSPETRSQLMTSFRIY